MTLFSKTPTQGFMDADVAAAVILELLELLQQNQQHADKGDRPPSPRHLQGWVSGALDIVMRRRCVPQQFTRQARTAALNLVFRQHPALSVNWPTYANDEEFQSGLSRGRAMTTEFLGSGTTGNPNCGRAATRTAPSQ
ncbi:MAG: hypothetical protein EOP81_01575 [Variovorax sp.]|nr:MAG: hypothetical protein EOP81_01575 [Variovorax sp.]